MTDAMDWYLGREKSLEQAYFEALDRIKTYFPSEQYEQALSRQREESRKTLDHRLEVAAKIGKGVGHATKETLKTSIDLGGKFAYATADLGGRAVYATFDLGRKLIKGSASLLGKAINFMSDYTLYRRMQGYNAQAQPQNTSQTNTHRTQSRQRTRTRTRTQRAQPSQTQPPNVIPLTLNPTNGIYDYPDKTQTEQEPFYIFPNSVEKAVEKEIKPEPEQYKTSQIEPYEDELLQPMPETLEQTTQENHDKYLTEFYNKNNQSRERMSTFKDITNYLASQNATLDDILGCIEYLKIANAEQKYTEQKPEEYDTIGLEPYETE